MYIMRNGLSFNPLFNYLPHYLVTYNNKATTKLRVVFDAIGALATWS